MSGSGQSLSCGHDPMSVVMTKVTKSLALVIDLGISNLDKSIKGLRNFSINKIWI